MTRLRSALVTGATGFIGSALARRLAQEGIRVFCLVRRGSDRTRLEGLSGIDVVEIGSFRTAEIAGGLKGISADVVFNLASYGVSQKDCDPEMMLEGNVNLLAGLMLATSKWPLKKFVHTGSCSEYGTPSGNIPLTEDHPVRPISLYGAAKAASVQYGNALALRLGMPFLTLRLFTVFGVGEGPQRLIPYMIDRLKRSDPVDLTPGEQVRDFLYIDDAVEAYVRAASSEEMEPRGVYNVCSGVSVRVRDVVETVAHELKKPDELLEWGKRPYRPDEPMWLVGDNLRFTDATGWRPKVGLAEGVGRMVEVLARNSAQGLGGS